MLWPTSHLARWALAFSITLAVEIPLVLRALRADEPQAWRRLSAAFLANAVSHPALFLGLASLVAVTGWVLVLGEIAVVALEAFVYRWRAAASMATALRVSLAANLASFAVGAAIHRLTGWP